MTNLLFASPTLGTVLSLTGLPGGSNKIHDRSPYGYTATIIGATWKRTVGGIWYLGFDGTDDYVNCGATACFNFGNGSFSLEVWIKTGQDNRHIVQKKYSGSPYTGYYLGVGTQIANKPTFYMYAPGASNVITGDTNVTDDTWHHIVAVRDQGVDLLYLYVDGVSDATPVAETDRDIDSTEELEIGSNEARNLFFNGGISLPRIYPFPLSALKAQKHFNREKHLFGVW